jgi:hypothetical protein
VWLNTLDAECRERIDYQLKNGNWGIGFEKTGGFP